MEMRVQVLHSGVVMGWGGSGSTSCGSNEVWLKKLWLNKLAPPIRRTSDPCTPFYKKENLCDWGVLEATGQAGSLDTK